MRWSGGPVTTTIGPHAHGLCGSPGRLLCSHCLLLVWGRHKIRAEIDANLIQHLVHKLVCLPLLILALLARNHVSVLFVDKTPRESWQVEALREQCTSKASSMASPIISLVISMRSFCLSNSRMIFCNAGMFICLFIRPMAFVAPLMASAMACVDLRVCKQRH